MSIETQQKVCTIGVSDDVSRWHTTTCIESHDLEFAFTMVTENYDVFYPDSICRYECIPILIEVALTVIPCYANHPFKAIEHLEPAQVG